MNSMKADERDERTEPEITADVGRLRFNDELGLPQTCVHEVHRVYFRAGLLACREYMARFVDIKDPELAFNLRTLWWPALGDDPGQPRKLDWNEASAAAIDISIEALPIAAAFLNNRGT